MRVMYKKRNRREIKSEINIVPLLDVLLVLLLIFMATAPIISQSVSVDLPQSSSSQMINANADNKPVILEVAGVEQYALLVDTTRREHLSEDEIVAQVQGILTEKPETLFLVGGAKDVPYEEVIKALNLLQQSGVSSVGLMTRPI